MATLELTEDQVLVLKAAWEYMLADDDHINEIAEALQISFEERNMDEDGDYVEDKDESDDPVEKRVAEMTQLIMNL